MKIAFWNINLGTWSFDGKQKTFSAWCAAIKPDLLVVVEASETLTRAPSPSALEVATGMTTLNYVNTLDVNGNTTTKQLVALTQPHNPFGLQARTMRLDGLLAKRAAIKVTASKQPEIYGIHANASIKGGEAAKDAAAALAGSDHSNVLIGGDFNGAMPTDGSAIASLRWDDQPMPFTQWTPGDGNGSQVKQEFGLKTCQIASPPKPNGLIDYVVPGGKVAVKPLNAFGGSETLWADIAGQFDHSPIVYDVQLTP